MKKYTVGVDLGGTNTKIALLKTGPSASLRTGPAKILSHRVLKTKKYKNKTALLETIASEIKDILKEGGIRIKDVQGVGVGVPGLVDVNKGLVYYLVNIFGWKNVKVGSILRSKLRLPVFVDNDVNVMALAEARFGAGRGAKNLVCVTVGTGVGGGIIIDGRLYRGSTLSAGEVGHIPLNEKGLKCNCGGKACLETYVGNSYMIRRAVRAIKAGRRTAIRKIVKGDLSKVTPLVIQHAAKKKDKFAREIWNDAGKYLGLGLVAVVNMLNPEVIVVGGGLSGAGELLLGPARTTVRERAMQLPGKSVKIVKARLGKRAGVIGAGELACRASQERPSLELV